ncbi:universal stress protein [Desulfobacterales bacterium HSG16]|nr:universal stress protein [Desulfobacterales bacterium HSG16]
MIPEIKTILYTTDLSENARYAFNYAAAIAIKFDAKIIFFHVIEELSAGTKGHVISLLGESTWREMLQRKENDLSEIVTERLKNFCDEMGTRLQECRHIMDDIKVAHGQPVEEILKYSQVCGCDMIVMGTHGYGLLADALMGSVSRRVVRKSIIPVMTVRLPE